MHFLNNLSLFFFFASNGAASVVTSIFGGILQNEVNCLICGTESRKFDPFLGNLVKNSNNYLFLNQILTGCHQMMVMFSGSFPLDLSLDIPSQFRQKRSKDQEPGPTCTLRGKSPLACSDSFSAARLNCSFNPFVATVEKLRQASRLN